MAKSTSTLLLNAAPEKVWEAMTNLEKVKRWQFGSDLIKNWLIGTPIEFSTEYKGTVYKQWGTILEIKPYELIKYNLFAPQPGVEDKPENYFIMSYVLLPENSATRLKIIREDNKLGADQEEELDEENAILQALKSVVETD